MGPFEVAGFFASFVSDASTLFGKCSVDVSADAQLLTFSAALTLSLTGIFRPFLASSCILSPAPHSFFRLFLWDFFRFGSSESSSSLRRRLFFSFFRLLLFLSYELFSIELFDLESERCFDDRLCRLLRGRRSEEESEDAMIIIWWFSCRR